MIETNINSSFPIIILIPHSGSNYSKDFLKNILLTKKELEFSEDNYVDLILNETLKNNIPFVKAIFPRSYVDVNRNPLEIDPLMVSSNIPTFLASKSVKLKSGIGVIPRVSYYGNEIYGRLLTRKEIINRLLNNYFPYHKALKILIKKAKNKYKNILVLDFHSMPSKSIDNNVDIILGNNFDLSANKLFSSKIIKCFQLYNYTVKENNPYSGGYITKNYGRPKAGINVLQIEINRSLYMNEDTLEIMKSHTNILSNNLNLIIKYLNSVIINYNNIN